VIKKAKHYSRAHVHIVSRIALMYEHGSSSVFLAENRKLNGTKTGHFDFRVSVGIAE
jgi:hypothetical protein